MSTIHIRPDRSRRLLAVVTTALLLASVCSPALARGAAPHEPEQRGQALGRTSPGLGAELAQVRAATARYHDVETAIADGYAPSPDCVEDPGGDGAMGHHYVNMPLLLETLDSGVIDPIRPHVLLYIPRPDGQLRLVGVEYLSPPGGLLFGEEFADWSPLGDETALHVWLWQANPAGMFASYNPNLSC
jgi:hypothetical protein